MSTAPIIVWFREDLRLSDQPAWQQAATSGAPVLALYIRDMTPLSPRSRMSGRAYGAPQRWWLHHSLKNLSDDLARYGVPLTVMAGNPIRILADLVQQLGAQALHFNRAPTPQGRAQDQDLETQLGRHDILLRGFPGNRLFAPGTICKQDGTSYKVFTPFSQAAMAVTPRGVDISSVPDKVPAIAVRGLTLDELQLLADIPAQRQDSWARFWTPGEANAVQLMDDFAGERLRRYRQRRDFPDRDGTSRLSPHLRFGEISVRTLWHTLQQRFEPSAAFPFLRQLLWREFSYDLLDNAPDLATVPLKEKFAGFDWEDRQDWFEKWCRGETGFDLVDAAMRSLLETGWMHNRLRMIVGSFLVKDLMLPWQWGEKFFWDNLLDADPANNPAGWQWVAGCGADAAPYFRVFNPDLQAEKYDSKGAYRARFLPKEYDLPPMVDHKLQRTEALNRYRRLSDKSVPVSQNQIKVA